MRKILKLSLISLLTILSLSETIYAKDNNATIEHKKNDKIINYIQKEIYSLWGNPTKFNGNATVNMVFDLSTGKLATFFIYKKEGDEKFKKYFKDFISKLKKKAFKKYKTENPLVEIKVDLFAKTPKGYIDPNKYTFICSFL